MRQASFTLEYVIDLPDEYDDMDDEDIMTEVQEDWLELLDEYNFSTYFDTITDIC